MTPGRNDPCHCGSGKKYKHCCLRRDRDRKDAVREVVYVVEAAKEWQLDVVPLPTSIEADPTARLAVSVVTAGGLVVFSEVLPRPSPEVDDLARTLEEAARQAAADVGRLPPRLRVRDEDVAAALAARFAAGGAEDSAAPEVLAGGTDDLDALACQLAEGVTGMKEELRCSRPLTWEAWGLPDGLVARLFAAAAACYRAAPWETLDETEPFRVTAPQGTAWIGALLGPDDDEFAGVDLFADPEDYVRASSADTADFAPRSALLLLTFEPGGDVGRHQRREVRRKGWKIAGREAYPQLATINTPAGGLRRREAEDMLALLRALPAFIEQLREGGAVASALAWRHGDTGTVLGLMPASAAAHGPLHPGDAEGPGAEPEAALAGLVAIREDLESFATAELELLDRFVHHLAEEEGESSPTVARHVADASAFFEYIVARGIPVRAVHHRDLLDFLGVWYPRQSAEGDTHPDALPVSLGYLFSYLADHEGIVCPWAAATLGGRDGLEPQPDAPPLDIWWDPDVILWRQTHDDALIGLVMVPDDGMGDSDSWGPAMGRDEYRLYQELERRWLLWRDELLREGMDDWEELSGALIERQRAWERAPHPDFHGDNPMTAVWRERKTAEKNRRGKGRRRS